MKSKVFQIHVVVRCKDCGYEVGRLLLEFIKNPEKLTKKERFWLVHMSLAEAIQDGTVSADLLEAHNTEAELLFK